MPVSFLSTAQRESYGRYAGDPSADELARYFHLDDADRVAIAEKRGDHNRLGFALQLTTVRFLGTFLEKPADVPSTVLQSLRKQLAMDGTDGLADYAQAEQRWVHAEQIRTDHGYQVFTDPIAGFRLTRWLYAQCWTGTERPSVLFDRATTWMLAQRVLLPGASVLERFVARLRERVETRLWRRLGGNINEGQQAQLAALLRVPDGARHSPLDDLRTGPVTISGPALVRALQRLHSVRSLGIAIPQAASIPPSRIASLARFADKAKVSAVMRLPEARRLATLVAFIHTLEASAQDDAIELFEMLLTEVFGDAEKEDKKARLRSLKDLDALAITLAEACRLVVDPALPDESVRTAVYACVPRDTLIQTLQDIGDLVRPPDDVFYKELQNQHRRVRRFLPALLEHIHFSSGPAEAPLLAGLEYLRRAASPAQGTEDAPLDVVPPKWRRHVADARGVIAHRAYTF